MNLLPKTEKDILKKGLRLRSVVVTLFLLSATFVVGFIMLIPSYLLTLGYFAKDSSEGQYLQKENEEVINNTLNLPREINSKLKFFQSNVAGISIIDFISNIISRVPGNMTVDSVSFSRNKSHKEKTGLLILISGVASNRDSLVSFSNKLKETNLFSSVEVPVSNLTRDKNLPFSVNIFIEN